ncbi:MAG: signal peptidase I [Oscillospiraceae bacterium]|nr:signal peptidase I [Oscillospiraceae bacterium]
MDDPNITAAADPVSAGAAPANAREKPQKKRTAGYYAAAFFLKIGLTAAVLWLLLTFAAGVYICHTNSAYPSIRDGDFCLTNRLAKPEQGTMIVYRHDGAIRFGRIIAFGGDRVSLFTDYISVNDSCISDQTVYPNLLDGSAVSYPYTVPENCVFVLNDFRSDLSDSRTFGGIPLEELQGAVVFTMRMRGI